MEDDDVISLSSDSSRPSSPFINVSEVFNDSEKRISSIAPNDLRAKDNDYLEINNLRTNDNLKFHRDRRTHNLSDSDNSTEFDINTNETDLNTERFVYKSYQQNLSESDNADDITKNSGLICQSPTKNKVSVIKVKMTKEQRIAEKERKRQEKEKNKCEKRAVQERQNLIKPGNCMKFMTVVLDSSLVNCPFGGTLLAAIQNSEARYDVSTRTVPFSLCWTRDLLEPEHKEEEFLVIIWQWQMFVPAVKNHSLLTQIQGIKTNCRNKTVSLVIYGLNAYFSYLKRKGRKGAEDSTKGRKRKSEDDGDFPYLTKNQIEEELIELQLMANCNHRLVESQEELAQLIVHITKAIAETPFKLDKQKRELENLEWFAVGDSRDCVTVDKAGNGLLRLWQQQLCQFNLAGHDVAQAIVKTYPSPSALMQAYDNCRSKDEGEGLLKDILVRRCQGPISSSRRVGPELSKKIFTFFSATVGDIPLSQEK